MADGKTTFEGCHLPFHKGKSKKEKANVGHYKYQWYASHHHHHQIGASNKGIIFGENIQ